MTYFVICNDFLFVIGHNCVFLLISRNYHLDALFKVSLFNNSPAASNGTESGFIDNIRKLCARCARSHSCNGVEIHIVRSLYLLCVDLEYCLTSRKVGKLHGNTAVETARTGECGVKGFGTVGGGEDYNAVVALKAVHFSKELIKSLLTLIISANVTVTLFAYGIYLIDEHYAGSLFLCLLEQVTNLRCTHSHEHLNKFRA